MTSKDQYDQFAAEMARRFEDFTCWAIEHWPNREMPLLDSDFMQSRKEISFIVGPKLGNGASEESGRSEEVDGKYIETTPMPWP